MIELRSWGRGTPAIFNREVHSGRAACLAWEEMVTAFRGRPSAIHLPSGGSSGETGPTSPSESHWGGGRDAEARLSQLHLLCFHQGPEEPAFCKFPLLIPSPCGLWEATEKNTTLLMRRWLCREMHMVAHEAGSHSDYCHRDPQRRWFRQDGVSPPPHLTAWEPGPPHVAAPSFLRCCPRPRPSRLHFRQRGGRAHGSSEASHPPHSAPVRLHASHASYRVWHLVSEYSCGRVSTAESRPSAGVDVPTARRMPGLCLALTHGRIYMRERGAMSSF